MKLLRQLGNRYIELAKIIPADLFIFGGLFLQNMRWVLVAAVDTNTQSGMWLVWAYDFFAGYYVISGVIFYFTRYLHRWYKHRKTT